MPGSIISVILLIFSTVSGASIGWLLFSTPEGTLLSGVAGLVVAGLCVAVLRIWLKLEGYKIVGGLIGTFAGALLAFIICSGFSDRIVQPAVAIAVYVTVCVVFSLVGMQIGAIKAQDLMKNSETLQEPHQVVAILDTSVIIDGRIADVCETGFLYGDLIIPQFILKELQMIADSSESTKRTRGRRGLDILKRIPKQNYVSIIIDDKDYPAIKEVDQKLIQMAKETGYAILTNDYNLNKVADVQSIQVLNINQLANALKPVVLPGETIKVKIMKEGKEHTQGVAYLDDGTMVVIDHGRRHIGKNMDVVVTSVLQTTAGRMIFASLKS